jgi:hypothetical protein
MKCRWTIQCLGHRSRSRTSCSRCRSRGKRRPWRCRRGTFPSSMKCRRTIQCLGHRSRHRMFRRRPPLLRRTFQIRIQCTRRCSLQPSSRSIFQLRTPCIHCFLLNRIFPQGTRNRWPSTMSQTRSGRTNRPCRGRSLLLESRRSQQ